MKRLLLISTEFPPGPGGIATHAYQLASGATRRGWDVLVLSTQDYRSDDEIKAFNAQLPFRVVRLRRSSRRSLSASTRFLQVIRSVREWKPDVGVASGDPAVYLMAASFLATKTPWIAIEHGRIPPDSIEPRLKRWSFGRATATVSVSHYSERRLHAQGVRPRRSLVIHNGADDSVFQPICDTPPSMLRASLGLPDGKLIITVGSVTERKGQDVVIRALPGMLARIPDLHYVVVGHPLRRREFEAIAAELGVQGHVHFFAPGDNATVNRFVNASDVFVMTSRHTHDQFEGFGIAVVEAAFCGKPAVVSRESGLSEAIIDGVTGIGVPENDPGATAGALLSLLEDGALRERMGREAQRNARLNQSWDCKLDEYDRLLNEMRLGGQMRKLAYT